jgi:hypothetical protein
LIFFAIPGSFDFDYLGRLLRFVLPHRASITFRMIARRSSAVVPAQRAAWAFPAAALPPRRPSATAAGFFRFAMRGILASGRVGTCRLPYIHRYMYYWSVVVHTTSYKTFLMLSGQGLAAPPASVRGVARGHRAGRGQRGPPERFPRGLSPGAGPAHGSLAAPRDNTPSFAG